MKAAVFYGAGKPLEIEDVQISKPGPHEVLLRTSAAGVCHSDLHFVEGLYPMAPRAVLGHESAGIVEQVGYEVQYVKPGDHVITCLSVFCGICDYCRPDEPPRLSQGDERVTQFANLSSFAEQMLVHENAVVKIREDMPMDRAAVIGCGVTTGVGAALRTAQVRPGTTVAVIGCGGVGLSAINGAAIAGAGRIIAIDRLDSKLELAKTFGATDIVNASDGTSVEQVKELVKGGVHYSFEAIGLKQTTEDAWNMLRAGGTATVIGMIPVGTKVEIHGPDFLREKKIQGSSMGSNRFRTDMPRYIEFYLSGKLKLDELISSHIKLEEINAAMENLKTGEVARQLIMFDA